MKQPQIITVIERAIEVCKQRARVLSKELEGVKAEILSLLERLETLEKENIRLKEENEELKKLLESVGIERKRIKIDKEELKKGVRYLFASYLDLWKENPPEKLKSPNWKALLGRTFKQLIEIYEGDYRKLWKDYAEFFELYLQCKNSKSKWVKDCRFFYDGSMLNFKKKLPEWKQRAEVSVSERKSG